MVGIFHNRRKKEERQLKRSKQKEAYARVYALHEQADFLCYINDAYMEPYGGKDCIKLEGLVAKGTGKVTDTFRLYSCRGNFKAEITMVELYNGANPVEQIEGGDKRVALYPREQQVAYKAGDILCKQRNSAEGTI